MVEGPSANYSLAPHHKTLRPYTLDEGQFQERTTDESGCRSGVYLQSCMKGRLRTYTEKVPDLEIIPF